MSSASYSARLSAYITEQQEFIAHEIAVTGLFPASRPRRPGARESMMYRWLGAAAELARTTCPPSGRTARMACGLHAAACLPPYGWKTGREEG